MDSVKKITDIPVIISKKEVLQMLNCDADCSSYEAVSDLYDEVLEDTRALLDPVILFCFGTVPKEYASGDMKEGEELIYAITSVGGEISRKSSAAFRQGDPLSGMLLNAIADSALFHMEESLNRVLRKACTDRKRGILKRLEAPQDIPMETQKLVFEQTHAAQLYQMKISSGFMLDPVKSSANIFLLTSDEKVFRAQHDCRNCSKLDCSMRKE